MKGIYSLWDIPPSQLYQISATNYLGDEWTFVNVNEGQITRKDLNIEMCKLNMSGDGVTNRQDIIKTLQFLAGYSNITSSSTNTDVNDDEKIGLEELIHCLNHINLLTN